MSALTSTDYAELLTDPDSLSPTERIWFEIELNRALKREGMKARISEEKRQYNMIHAWQLETHRVAVHLLALQFEVGAWMARRGGKSRPYDETRRRMGTKHAGFLTRMDRLRKDIADGNAQQQKWAEDHAELLAAVESGGEPQ